MIIADTSFLVAFYHEIDSNHQEAVSLMQKHEHEGLLISDYVLGETATVLLYKKKLESSLKFIEMAEETESVKLLKFSEQDFQQILDTFRKQKHQLSFIDASVVYLARNMNLAVLCFDWGISKELKLKES